jgi:hypothetical protein
MHIILILLSFLMITPSSAFAHGVKLFAVSNDGYISGQGYFVGGGAAVNCQIILQNQEGREILQTRTDGAGKFTFAIPAEANGPHLLLLNAGPGHAARVNLEFNAAGNSGGALAAEAEDGAVLADDLPASLPGPGSQLQLAQIERQLQNINQQLLALQAMHEPDVTFEKIAAGLGYIMGLLGTAMYFHYRPRPTRRNGYAHEP